MTSGIWNLDAIYISKFAVQTVSATLTPSATSIDEGSTLTITVATQNFGTGTLNWEVVQETGTIDASDISEGLSGTVSITDDSGSFDLSISADATTEGEESFTVRVLDGSTVLGTSSIVTINDTPVELTRALADDDWMIVYSGTYIFAAMEDNTVINRNGSSALTLNKQQTGTVSLNANDIISSTSPISFSYFGTGLTGIPYAWAGTKFAKFVDRYQPFIYMVATETAANVTITDDTGATTFSGTVGTSSFSSDTIYSAHTYVITSDNPIAVYTGDGTSDDLEPLYPVTTELYGTPSQRLKIAATEDNTNITGYYTDGTTFTTTINANQGFDRDPVGSSQYFGESLKLVADKPIAASAQADGDGGERTPFVGKDAFATKFVVPENEREFVKIVSDQPANITVFNSSGTQINTITLTGNSTNNIYNDRLVGTNAYEQVLIQSDVPVYAIYEGELDDESVLMGSLS